MTDEQEPAGLDALDDEAPPEIPDIEADPGSPPTPAVKVVAEPARGRLPSEPHKAADPARASSPALSGGPPEGRRPQTEPSGGPPEGRRPQTEPSGGPPEGRRPQTEPSGAAAAVQALQPSSE